ncbi:hypothetical protein ACIQXA_23740 [Streptomyces massasporeus]|uniref:hypothetical protein n=1 Tax=Streptomyces massasporeus TaxID=67324 RepID=UPI00381E2F58
MYGAAQAAGSRSSRSAAAGSDVRSHITGEATTTAARTPTAAVEKVVDIEAAWLTTVARSGERESEFVARLLPAAQQASAGYDHLTATGPETSAQSSDPAKLRDDKFAYGLEVVLDGLALRLPK